ncbi:GntR family transcriptional regulator [Streptomyces sp. NPDC090022]|uniref:GntR family transcriptional regulator n=1 Tax=Streptomyces sp. NPDC090022 TaxID=3365920 RepID=UPI00380E240E
MGTARYLEIAEALRAAILAGEHPVGAELPSESDLAARWSASRGTVRQAVAVLAAEGLIGSRQGARRIVLRQERRHSFGELNSFAQWAQGMGHEVTSRFLGRTRRAATDEEAGRLALAPGTEILYVLRLRCLDGEPTMVERTAYADWVAPAVEALPDDCRSVMDSLAKDSGIVAHYGEHLIDVLPAGSEDARLLELRRGSPLLRQRHLTSTHTGRPIEWTDDRYRAGSVTFLVSNSAVTAPLERHAGDLSRPWAAGGIPGSGAGGDCGGGPPSARASARRPRGAPR